jgi:hypothetical protein
MRPDTSRHAYRIESIELSNGIFAWLIKPRRDFNLRFVLVVLTQFRDGWEFSIALMILLREGSRVGGGFDACGTLSR